MLKEFFQTLVPKADRGRGIRQSGALPYALVDGRVVFLLVTSRKTGRWIFPKGSISQGMTAWDSAAKEALEEAGVSGQISSEAIGSYQNYDRGLPVEIDLYPMRVDAQFEQWQEMDQRLRHWALLAETKRLLVDRSIYKSAEALHRQITGSRTIQ